MTLIAAPYTLHRMQAKKSRSTKLVRVAPDLAHKLSAIVMSIENGRIAEVIDPLIRPEIERRYAALPAHVRKTAESRQKQRKAQKL